MLRGETVSKKYELIIDHIERLVRENRLKQGERLPSIRALAEEFGYNKSTVIRAYQELELKHRIYSIPNGGFYLVEKMPRSHDEYGCIDFSEVLPDPKLLPYKEFNHCINRAVELYKNTLFSYGDTMGLKSLREVLAGFFAEQQIFTSPENIFITSGAQQALSILAKMSFPNNRKNILVEQPTYGLMQELVRLNGTKLVGISRDNNEIDLNQLEMIFKNGDIKFFYTIPRLHNPLGTSYPEKIKKGIAHLAEKYDVYIVEDDYLADLDLDSRAMPVRYYDVSKRTVYVKSFSKAFMPGIRIGAVVLHDKLALEFTKHKRYDDLNTSILAQGALEIFINSGMYRNHVRKTKLEYKRKMDFFREYVKSLEMAGAELDVPYTGFFVWIKPPDGIKSSDLEKRLKDRKVIISPGRNYFIEGSSGENGFRLCISKLTKDQVKTGMGIMFEELNALQKFMTRR